MSGQGVRTTMSVAEMREMLGLKKTESYWLVHHNYFETVMVLGKMRIAIDSFEKWYASQTHYRKVNGEEPGSKLRSATFSVIELSELLGVSDSTIYELIAKNHFHVIESSHPWRISKAEFYSWYKSQKRYRTIADFERDRAAEEASYTIPEMGRLLGVDRNEAYDIVKKNRDLVVIRIAERKRVTKGSFENWYAGQSQYRKLCEQKNEEESHDSACDHDGICNDVPSDAKEIAAKTAQQGSKTWVTVREASVELKANESTVIRLIQSGELMAKKVGKHWLVLHDDVLFLSTQHRDAQEG